MTANFLDQITIRAEDFAKTKDGIIVTGRRVTLNLPVAPVRYLYSGWQSWSLTAWVNTDRPVRPMRPSSMHSLHTDPVYALETRPHGSWYGAVELPDEQILFLGALGLESHVMLDGQSLVGWYENGNGDWLLASGNETEIMVRYAALLDKRLGTGNETSHSPFRNAHHIRSAPYRVWCSWYSLYTEIYESQLLKILSDLGPLDNAQNLPFDVFQIDDGWQVGIGNWEPNAKFSSGMDGLATRIRETGRKAGLWLAPLLVVPSSSVYRDHCDWLLHDKNGILVSAGFNWGQPLFALDTTHPGVLDWLAALMNKVRRWGYDYAKLDFLYAGALPGKRYVDMPRETAYRNGLKTIREALGDAYMLTCGAPILPSIGLCDGIRVGPDVAGKFTSHLNDDLLMNFAIPGVRNALRTTFNRLWLKPLVHTDPDVVYFSARQNNLTPQQKSLLQDMAQICNFKASSDIPSWLTDSERSALWKFLKSMPEVRKIGRTTWQIGDHKLDFDLYINMPPLPGLFNNLQGVIISGLAQIRPLMKLFDKIGNYNLKKALDKNPV
jgi:alpha-galactosidase